MICLPIGYNNSQFVTMFSCMSCLLHTFLFLFICFHWFSIICFYLVTVGSQWKKSEIQGEECCDSYTHNKKSYVQDMSHQSWHLDESCTLSRWMFHNSADSTKTCKEIHNNSKRLRCCTESDVERYPC